MASTLILGTRPSTLAARRRSAFAWLRTGWKAWREEARRRRDIAATIAMLRGLDNATLRDLGMDRSGVTAAAIDAAGRLQRGCRS
jgi:hypothetical protein